MSGLRLSNERYLAALYRQRDRIISGIDFVAEDSDAVGNKYTHASWGLCSRDRAAWPDRDDHQWPDQFDAGRVAPKYRHQHQRCPMEGKNSSRGCFYSCQIFQSRQITAKKRAKAVELYEAAIEKFRTDQASALAGQAAALARKEGVSHG